MTTRFVGLLGEIADKLGAVIAYTTRASTISLTRLHTAVRLSMQRRFVSLSGWDS